MQDVIYALLYLKPFGVTIARAYGKDVCSLGEILKGYPVASLHFHCATVDRIVPDAAIVTKLVSYYEEQCLELYM